MKSSSGAHYIALDHIRAIAAFLVITWHFIHAGNGYPVPFEGAPIIFPFAILDEGHTGVALFMTLSGYLFAKLLNGKRIIYTRFLLNRALRLLPLLLLVILINYIINYSNNGNSIYFIKNILMGIALPTLPNGGWSITIEFHYYLLIPVFLWIIQKSPRYLLAVLVTAIIMRLIFYKMYGEAQSLSYWTLLGRIDQFTLGMLAFHLRGKITKQHCLFALLTVLYLLFYWYFDNKGGFYQSPTYPSPSRLWIIIPTIEAAFYGLLIAWYDSSFKQSEGRLSRILSQFGKFSYSFYLLHFFIVFKAASFVHENIMDISNFYIACLWSLAFYICMYPIGHMSYKYIESPFLKKRKSYLLQ
ncbi:MAG: acyltransferase [Candidatus Cloacimonetes bacterium]|nr:acyltransferase [Candidatus Cloacimonadota bacterium]